MNGNDIMKCAPKMKWFNLSDCKWMCDMWCVCVWVCAYEKISLNDTGYQQMAILDKWYMYWTLSTEWTYSYSFSIMIICHHRFWHIWITKAISFGGLQLNHLTSFHFLLHIGWNFSWEKLKASRNLKQKTNF